MKKTVLFLAAALALAACTKTAETPEGTSEGKALKFRLAVNTPTKSGKAFVGENAANISSYSGDIKVLASTHKADGSVFQKSIFGSDDRFAPGYFYHDGSSNKWSLQDESGNKFQYLPNGTHLNLVAIAGTEGISIAQSFYSDTYNDYQQNWGDNASSFYYQSEWKARGYKDFKSVDEYVAFPNVDTRKVQNDLMYAIESDIVNGETRTVTLKHAQALINVNIKIDGEVPSGIDHAYLAFVGGNVDLQSKMNINSGESYSTMKDFLMNYNQRDLTSNLNNFARYATSRYSDMDAFFPLKTIGSFIIDNRRNTPVVKWQFPKMKKVLENNYEHYNAILENLQSDIAFNPNRTGITSGYANFYTLFNNGSNYSGSDCIQVAGQLIPEQKTVNPWLFFKMNGTYYALEVNLPKGTWQAGHVYTYNLIVNFAGPKFNVVVENYTSPFHTEDVSI